MKSSTIAPGRGPSLKCPHSRVRTPPSPPNLQRLLGIESFDTLVIDRPAGLAKLEIDHRRAVAPITLGQTQNLGA